MTDFGEELYRVTFDLFSICGDPELVEPNLVSEALPLSLYLMVIESSSALSTIFVLSPTQVASLTPKLHFPKLRSLRNGQKSPGKPWCLGLSCLILRSRPC
jgi:hypothetical protein